MGVGIKHALFVSCKFGTKFLQVYVPAMNINKRALNSGFQSAYTTLFGAYAAFLFAKTGGIIFFFFSRKPLSRFYICLFFLYFS